MEYLILFAIIAGIAFSLTQKAKDNLHNYKLKKDLGTQKEKLERIERYFNERDDNFKKDFCSGRMWLSAFIAESKMALDTELENYLREKSHPAYKAAEVVSSIKEKKREVVTRLKFAEYQLKSYEEYFPFLEEFKEVILEERIPLGSNRDNIESLENIDPVLQRITREEWEKLSVSQRNQLALDRYLHRNKSKWEIGTYYERYLGYLRETDGWRVEFQGAIKGFEDFGRDLICSKRNIVEIVQAKCWSQTKVIHEKHIFQLFATTFHYGLEHPDKSVRAVLATTTAVSKAAKLVAKKLDIKVERIPLPKEWPVIKCNINPSTKEKIYHLPFDQQYDRAIIGAVPGECYAFSVEEAEQQGFRRAFKYHGVGNS
jgi:hypothetical protein